MSVASGASTGAAVGSVVPGLGTGVGALIGAGVTGLFHLFSGHQQADATKDAAKIAAASADKILAEQKRIFDLQRSDRAPYVAASLGALGQAQQLASQGHYMPLPAQQLGASSPAMPTSSMSLGQLGQRPTPMAGAPAEPMGVFRAPDGSTRRLPLRLEPELTAKNVQRIQ